YIPLDRRNIVYKTAELIKNQYSIPRGVDIYIEKNIPICAGLGGGSSNAAATLIALNKLWDLKLDDSALLSLATQIGADVPFCISGGTALAEGIGEKLTNIGTLPQFHIVLVKPSISISTSWAYSLIKLDQIKRQPNNKAMIEAINKG